MSGYGAQQVSLCLLKSSRVRRKIYVSLSSSDSIRQDFYDTIVYHGIKPFSLSAISAVFFIVRLCRSGSSIVVHGHSSKSLPPFLVLSILRPLFPRLNLVFTNHGYLRTSMVLCLIQSFFFNALSLLGCRVTSVERPGPMSMRSRLLFRKQQYIPNPLTFAMPDLNHLTSPTSRIEGFWSPSSARPLRLGFYGGLNQQKNPLFVIDVIRQMLASDSFALASGSQLHLSVIGDGPLLASLEQRLSRLRASFPCFSFELHGYAFGHELEELLLQLDIALFPSVYDSYNIAVRHAFSLGILSLSSDAIPWSIPSVLPTGSASDDVPIEISRLSLDASRWSDCIIRLLGSDETTFAMLQVSALDVLQREILGSNDSLEMYNKIYARAV